jgi:hypothetical protein
MKNYDVECAGCTTAGTCDHEGKHSAMPSGRHSSGVETAQQPALTWLMKQLEFEVVPIAKHGADTATLWQVLVQSAASWNEQSAPLAPKIRLRLGSPVDGLDDDSTVQDGVNQIVVRMRPFCPGQTGSDVEHCYDARRQATTRLYRDASGVHIDEADIELNGADPLWFSAAGAIDPLRLRALLVHEWGHVLGLDHSCGVQATHGVHAADELRACHDAGALRSVMYPDPLTSARPLLLAPTRDALEALRARYPSSPEFGPASAGAAGFLIACVVLAALRSRVRRRSSS